MEHYKKRLIRYQTTDHQRQKAPGHHPCRRDDEQNENANADSTGKLTTSGSQNDTERKAMRQKKVARKRAVCRAKFRHTDMELFKLGTSIPTSLCKTKQPYNVCTEKTLQLTCEYQTRDSKKTKEPLPKEAITEFIISSIEGKKKDPSKTTDHPSKKTTGRHSLPQLVPEMPMTKKVRFTLATPKANDPTKNARQTIAKRRKTVIGTETYDSNGGCENEATDRTLAFHSDDSLTENASHNPIATQSNQQPEKPFEYPQHDGALHRPDISPKGQEQNSRSHQRNASEDPPVDHSFHAYEERLGSHITQNGRQADTESENPSLENQPINLSVKQASKYRTMSQIDTVPAQTRTSNAMFPEIKEQITRLGNTSVPRSVKTRIQDKKFETLIKCIVDTSKAAMTLPFSIPNLLIINQKYRELQTHLTKTCVSKKLKFIMAATMNELISYVCYQIFGDPNNMHFRLYTEKLLDTCLDRHKIALENFLQSFIYTIDENRFREFLSWISFISANRDDVKSTLNYQERAFPNNIPQTATMHRYQVENGNFRTAMMEPQRDRQTSEFSISSLLPTSNPKPSMPPPYPQFPTNTIPVPNPRDTMHLMNPKFPISVPNALPSSNPHSYTLPYRNLQLPNRQPSTTSSIAMQSNPQFLMTTANTMASYINPFQTSSLNTMSVLNPQHSFIIPSPVTQFSTSSLSNPQYSIATANAMPQLNTQCQTTAIPFSNPQLSKLSHIAMQDPELPTSRSDHQCSVKNKRLTSTEPKLPESEAIITNKDVEEIVEKNGVAANRITKSVIVKDKSMEITKGGRSLKERSTEDARNEVILEKIEYSPGAENEAERKNECNKVKVNRENLETSPDFQLFKEILIEEDRNVYKKVLKKLVRVKQDTARPAVIMIDDDEDISIQKVDKGFKQSSIDLTKEKIQPFLIDLTNTCSKTVSSKNSDGPPRKKFKKNMPLKIFGEILVVDDDDSPKIARKDENHNCIEDKDITRTVIEDISGDESRHSIRENSMGSIEDSTPKKMDIEDVTTELEEPSRKIIVTPTIPVSDVNNTNKGRYIERGDRKLEEANSTTEIEDPRILNICSVPTTETSSIVKNNTTRNEETSEKDDLLEQLDLESRSNIIKSPIRETNDYSKTVAGVVDQNCEECCDGNKESALKFERESKTNVVPQQESETQQEIIDIMPVETGMEPRKVNKFVSSSTEPEPTINRKTERNLFSGSNENQHHEKDILLEQLEIEIRRNDTVTQPTSETNLSKDKGRETPLVEDGRPTDKTRQKDTASPISEQVEDEPMRQALPSPPIAKSIITIYRAETDCVSVQHDTESNTGTVEDIVSAEPGRSAAGNDQHQDVEVRRYSIISSPITDTNKNADINAMVHHNQPQALNEEKPRRDDRNTDAPTEELEAETTLRDGARRYSIISPPPTRTVLTYALPQDASKSPQRGSDSERSNPETATVIVHAKPEQFCTQRATNSGVFIPPPPTQDGNSATPRCASTGRKDDLRARRDFLSAQVSSNGYPSASLSRSFSVPLAWHPWVLKEPRPGLPSGRRQSVETISNAGSDYSPEASAFEIRLDSKWYRISKNLYDKIPKGKLRYLREKNAFVRYCDGNQMEQFVENTGEDQNASGDLRGEPIENPVRYGMYLGPVQSGEVVEMAEDVRFSSEAYVSEPEMYCEEVSKVERFIPLDFYGFYVYVTGFQIVHGNPPISFHTFLMMHNTNRTILLLKKYIYNLLTTGIVNFSFSNQDPQP